MTPVPPAPRPSAEPISWLDLHVAGDPHPRRFSTEASVRAYLLKVERLSPDAVLDLLAQGVLETPAARREYRLHRLPPAESGE